MSNTTQIKENVILDIPGARDIFPNVKALELFRKIADRHIAARAQLLLTDLCILKGLTNKMDWSELPPGMQATVCIFLSVAITCKFRDASSYIATKPKQKRAQRLLKRLIMAGVWPDIVSEYQQTMIEGADELLGMVASDYAEIDGGF